MNVSPGKEAFVRFEVTEADTAPAVGSGDVPVLATPRLIAWCEAATVAAVADSLGGGETSVGTRVVVDHLAASRPGATVEARAVLTEAKGRRLRFAVACRDEEGRLIAEGVVERVVVDRERFLGR